MTRLARMVARVGRVGAIGAAFYVGLIAGNILGAITGVTVARATAGLLYTCPDSELADTDSAPETPAPVLDGYLTPEAPP